VEFGQHGGNEIPSPRNGGIACKRDIVHGELRGTRIEDDVLLFKAAWQQKGGVLRD